jgi:hypothetical protein
MKLLEIAGMDGGHHANGSRNGHVKVPFDDIKVGDGFTTVRDGVHGQVRSEFIKIGPDTAFDLTGRRTINVPKGIRVQWVGRANIERDDRLTPEF